MELSRLSPTFAHPGATGPPRPLADPGPHGRPWLPAPLVVRLVAAGWPGNVRQLLNLARRLAIGNRDRDEAALDPELGRELAPGGESPPPEPGAEAPAPRPALRKSYRPPAEVSEAELLAALRGNRWRLQPTAQSLGLSRTSLYALIDQCPAIRKAADLDREEIQACLERTGGDLDAAVEILEVSRHGLLLRLKELGLTGTGGGRTEDNRGEPEADS